jgi:hypothetical protein
MKKRGLSPARRVASAAAAAPRRTRRYRCSHVSPGRTLARAMSLSCLLAPSLAPAARPRPREPPPRPFLRKVIQPTTCQLAAMEGRGS